MSETLVEIAARMSEAKSQTIGEMAARIAVLDTDKTAAQQAMNAIGEERNDLEAQMLEKMEIEGLRSITTREQHIPTKLEGSLREILDDVHDLRRETVGTMIQRTCDRLIMNLTEGISEVCEKSSAHVPAMTVHLRRELWISAPNGKEAAISALRACDAAPLVTETYNASSASSWMRELPRDDDDMPVFPEGVGDRLGTSEKYSIRTRKGS